MLRWLANGDAFEAGRSGRRDNALGRSLKNLSHYPGALRADQRILADKERRHAADRALTRRQRIVFQPQLVARRTNCLRDFVFVEAALGPETRDQFRIADVRALNEIRAIDAPLQLVSTALLASKFACGQSGARAGENRG